MDISRLARGGTPITLDKPRLLLFDMAALWLLIQKYGNNYLQELYGVPPESHGKKAGVSLVLKSMDALQFYLWAGLQAQCKLTGEELTIEQAGEFIEPVTFSRIFDAVITALFRSTQNPGKPEAAAARPAAVAEARPPQRKRSTSTKNKSSRSAPSAGRPKPSGRPR